MSSAGAPHSMDNRDFHLIQADLCTALAPETEARFHPEVYEAVFRIPHINPEQYLNEKPSSPRSFLFMVEKVDTKEVVAYRYFYFYGNACCSLYSIFVAPPYRLQGIASALIKSSIQHAAKQGFTQFFVPMADATPERTGLFNYYVKLMEDLPSTLNFQVKYKKNPYDKTDHHAMNGRR